MIKVLEVPLQLDLTDFAAFLWQHRIPHRILEQSDSQQLWVAASVNPEQVLALFTLWREGADLAQIDVKSHAAPSANLPRSLLRLPVTSGLILISGLLALLTGLGENINWLHYFTMADLIQQNGGIYTSGLSAGLERGEVWRLITPIFLHFSPPHLIFNLLWIWFVAARIERMQGGWVLTGIVLFSGLASNLAQYFVSGPLFGGMSGVVFAVMAYTWLWDRRANAAIRFNLPPAMMVLMILWLALGYSGVLESAGMGAVANTAHLVGLLAGLVAVPLVARLKRW